MGRTGRARSRRRLSQARRARDASADPVVVGLVQWLGQRGWRPEVGLRVSRFPDTGRGLMMLENVRAGSVLISVPLQAVITRDTALASELRSQSQLSTHQLLALFLVQQKRLGVRSPWQPYIRSLPETFSVPFYCAEDEIESLPSTLNEMCNSQRREVHCAFQNAVRSAQNQSFSIDEFAWAWFVVNTRAVYIGQNATDDNRMALVPFLDLFNHSSESCVRAGVNLVPRLSGQVYQIVTDIPFDRFSEVLINYGPHDNSRLFVEYGFALPDNVHESVSFSVAELLVAARRALTERQAALIAECQLDRGLCVTSAGVSWNTVLCLHVLVAAASQKLPSAPHEVFRAEPKMPVLVPAIKRLLETKLAETVTSCACLESKAEAGRLTESAGVALQLLKGHSNIILDALTDLKKWL